MSTLKRAFFTLAVALTASAAQAGWQDAASTFDQHRLTELDEARAKGIEDAQEGPDMAVIHAVLDPAPREASARSLAGNWRCRTIKLGGLAPDIIYGWFRCRISARDGEISFEKLTGSQRILGKLYPREQGGFVFLAGFSVMGEPAHAYSGNHPSFGTEQTPDDAIGLLSSTGPKSARIEIPYPALESVFDVIELKR